MTDTPRKRRNRNPTNTSSRLSISQLRTMDWLFPGFAREYLATHDADGKPLPTASMRGLRYIGDDRSQALNS